MIKRIHHLTRRDIWEEKIKREGILKPLTESDINYPHICETLSEKTKSLIKYKKYLVGIPPGYIHKWEKYGLIYFLNKHVAKMNFGWDSPEKDELINLSIPILNFEDAFVREHKYPTSKYGDRFMRGAVADVETSDDMNTPTEEHIKFVEKLQVQYKNSTIRLKDFHHQFEVPEVWLPQETPVDLIKVIKYKY